MKNAWKVLGSIRLAIILFILIAAASIAGTLIPQHRPQAEYVARYGNAGKLVGALALDHLYQSPGFLGLSLLFAVNISVCTLIRLPAKLRKAFGPGWTETRGAFESWKIRDAFSRKGAPGDIAAEAGSGLRRLRYRIRERTDGRRILLRGTKNALGGFGADFVHLGLLIVIAGGIASGLGSFKTDIALTEGRTAPVKMRGLELRLDRFETDTYPNGNVKDWKSTVTLLKDGRALTSQTIEVNHPLSSDGMMFYQSGYGRDWDSPILGLRLRKKNDPAYLKNLSLRPGKPVDAGDGITIAAIRFVPDFVLTGKDEVSTRSLEPNNPAALIEVSKDGGKSESVWVFARYPEFTHLRETGTSDLSLELKEFEAPEYSVILAARDPGAPVIWAGCALLMAGLLLSFYWPAREIRIVLEPGQGPSTSIAAGGMAAKDRDRLETEFKEITTVLRSH